MDGLTRAGKWRRDTPADYGCLVRDHLPPGLPPDPFADDPSDPSAALDALEVTPAADEDVDDEALMPSLPPQEMTLPSASVLHFTPIGQHELVSCWQGKY